MKLRAKTLIALACTCFIVMGINTLVARHIVSEGFANLEEREARLNVRRVQKTIKEMAAGLAVTTKDYAAWDESYVFVQDGNNGYIEKNLADEALANLKISIIAFLRNDGTLVYAKGFNPNQEKEAPVSPAFLSHLVSPAVFGKRIQPGTTTGLLLHEDDLFLIASQPILRSDLGGPSPGILVMCKLLDEGEKRHLSENLDIALQLTPISQKLVPESLTSETDPASSEDGIAVKIVNDDVIHGLTVLKGIEGRPAAVLQTILRRDITRQGRVSAFAATMLLLGGGMVFFVVVAVVLERTVLARLERLIHAVGAIAMHHNGSSRVPVEGRDELARLANGVNEMLRTLQERKAAFRSAFDHSNIGMAVISNEGGFIETNERLCKMLGYTREELLATGWNSVLRPEEQNRSASPQNFGEGTAVEPPTERRFLHKDGRTVWIIHSRSVIQNSEGIPLYTIVQCQDITPEKLADTAREKLESQLLQAQKMEAIGTLAGGVAHDFNNVLMAIIGYTEMSLQKVNGQGMLHHNLSQILRAGLRARDVIKQIVTFSRRDDQELRPISLKPIMLDAAKLLRASLPANVEIRTESSPQVGSVLGNASQIHQVVMNLCTNAAHAMEEKGGIMELALDVVSETDDISLLPADLSPGSYVRLSVRDQGMGIEPHLLERVCEPYFTTKEQGKGTGLGLAVVHGIVKSHQGALGIKSVKGEGTAVDVYFPRLTTAPDETPAPEQNEAPGNGRILFVDDEFMLVELAETMLGRLGYDVTATMNSKDALELFRERPYAFDLVITDLNMPLMAGDVLAEELRSIREDIPIILCTGFNENRSARERKGTAIKEVLSKPFSFSDLSDAIRRTLQG